MSRLLQYVSYPNFLYLLSEIFFESLYTIYFISLTFPPKLSLQTVYSLFLRFFKF